MDPYNPLVSLNGLKRFNFTNNISAACGFQTGVNFRDNRKPMNASLIYTNIVINNLWLNDLKIIGGAYYNSRHYGGPGDRLGAWCAAEIAANKHWHFLAESILGNNALSYTSIGTTYYIREHLPLTLGLQIPNIPRNSHALVFELTVSP